VNTLADEKGVCPLVLCRWPRCYPDCR